MLQGIGFGEGGLMVDERSLGSYELDHSSVVVPSSVFPMGVMG